jgi:hypothetical protein
MPRVRYEQRIDGRNGAEPHGKASKECAFRSSLDQAPPHEVPSMALIKVILDGLSLVLPLQR